MPLPPTYKFRSIPALIGLYTKFGSDPRTVLLKGFQIPPAGKLVDCSILVELLSFCISNDTDFWHELHVNLYSLTWKVHLFVRFLDIFWIWQLNSNLSLTA